LKAVHGAFEAGPHTKVIGGDVRIALTDPERMTMLEAYESVYAYRQQEYIEKMGFSGTGNLAMRREVYNAVGAFGGIEIAEDRDWGRRASAAGITISYIPEMIVFHPARSSFNELYEKWSRHLAHDFVEQVNGTKEEFRWLIKAIALLFSPIWETVRIVRSRRICGLRARFVALIGLAKIRIYRAGEMLFMLISPNRAVQIRNWNRT
jgi:GT2 family glycosyltransferase